MTAQGPGNDCPGEIVARSAHKGRKNVASKASWAYFQLTRLGFGAWTLDRILKSDDFIEDARSVASIPNNSFAEAIDAVTRATGFVGRQRLLSAVRLGIQDAFQAESLTNFIINFHQLRRDVGMSPEDFARDVSSRLPVDELNDNERRTIIERLPQVLAPKPGLDRQAKVEDVVRRTGAHIDELSIVSDLRPIFDGNREKIEGLVPIATLKLVTHGHEGIKAVEVQITEQELSHLCEEAERAKRKLAILKGFINNQSDIELPESVMTFSESSES